MESQRASYYLVLFKEAGFDVWRREAQDDEEGRESMRNGFVVDERFCGNGVDDLYFTQLKVALKVVEKEGKVIWKQSQ